MQQHYPHPSWIEIDLDQFKKNIALVRQYIGSTLYCLPIKANAYGHGLCTIGKIAEASGVDYLAVAHLQEGIALREVGVQIPILVLGAIHEDQIPDLIHFSLEFTISSQFKADLVAKIATKLKKTCRIHLEVDTGMQRTGVRCTTARTLFQYLQKHRCFEIIGIYSHLATADSPDDPSALDQIDNFRSLLSDPLFQSIPLIRHLANSGGTLFFPQSHLDMVRPSLLTFGYQPESPLPFLEGITPCFSLKAKVSYFKVVAKGSGIGYGHSHITKKETRIVTVPIGYGDGYRHALSNRASVLIRGRRFPIVGNVCMDQFMVDVGSCEAYVGDEVVLIGKQGEQEIPLTEIAKLCDTIPYEVLCLFNHRLPRLYKP